MNELDLNVPRLGYIDMWYTISTSNLLGFVVPYGATARPQSSARLHFFRDGFRVPLLIDDGQIEWSESQDHYRSLQNNEDNRVCFTLRNGQEDWKTPFVVDKWVYAIDLDSLQNRATLYRCIKAPLPQWESQTPAIEWVGLDPYHKRVAEFWDWEKNDIVWSYRMGQGNRAFWWQVRLPGQNDWSLWRPDISKS